MMKIIIFISEFYLVFIIFLQKEIVKKKENIGKILDFKVIPQVLI